MDALHTFNHLLNFAAPAAALAVLLALAGRFFKPKGALALSLIGQVAIIFVVGVAVLAGGLVLWGRDGKMLTYAALVLACASCQWVLVRGWRG
ncbi:MAG: hypothetical protein QM569_08085 [Acidovorax sp.]|uniref:hypothetical protein n=1 Tax=Acidovorax sp. TaxID=1872122 RepID=UPI0039E410ED